MGMAASQARYLALLARKSNCEYEGQQINQSRLALSNQSADLFNQMMALQVPTTPSKSDFTIQKYTFTDGVTKFTIDKWNKLSDVDGDGYNYAITYRYDKTEYTGFQKYRLNPQVQFSGTPPTSSTIPENEVEKIQDALKNMATAETEMNKAYDSYLTAKKQAGNLSVYLDNTTTTNITACDKVDNTYNITSGGNDYSYTNYNSLDEGVQNTIKDYIEKLIDYGAIQGDKKTYDYSQIYYCDTLGTSSPDAIAFAADLAAIKNSEGTIVKTTLPIYHVTGKAPDGANYKTIKEVDDNVHELLDKYYLAKSAYEAAEDVYEKCDVPVTIGNIKVKPLASLDKNQLSAVCQILQSMKEEDIDTNVKKCFNTLQEEYNNDTYIGGLYTFEMAGVTYYTTYYDMYNSIINGTGINSIDDQAKLPYYGAIDTEQPEVVKTRALIESDESGRFISMRMENDSLVYDLKSVSETDELAYDDAMSEYNYQRALYDKQVSDINAKTSIIQKQDQNLELRLKQLDTEQSALNTEIEAVSKVVKDNIEKSFKTFSG